MAQVLPLIWNMRYTGGKSKLKRAFTLVEVLIVVLILGILLAIAVPMFLQARENAQTKACYGNQRLIEDAKNIWIQDTGQPSTAAPAMADLVPQFLKREPACPTHGTYVLGTGLVTASCPNHPQP